MTTKALVEFHFIWDREYYPSLVKNKVRFPYLHRKHNMWLLHIYAHKFSRWCKHYKIFKLDVLHPSPSYVIIQVLLIFWKTLLCTPRPSIFLLSITLYENKCLRKRLNWNMFSPKNKLIIYLLNLFLEKHLNISDKIWEFFLPHLALKTSLFRLHV